jgi:hypothetical protein
VRAERSEIRSLEIDGITQDLAPYGSERATLAADWTYVSLGFGAGDERFYTTSSRCGAYTEQDDLQPSPPAAGAACSHSGMHCHWPDVSASCAARCTGGSWRVAGCP